MKLHPSTGLHGTISVPGDKSVSHRSVMLGALADGVTHVSGFLMAEDCLSTIDCFCTVSSSPSSACTLATAAQPPV